MTGERVHIAAIVAMAENNCIGKDNDLPWHVPADLQRFKEITRGKPVIMGRKTFLSIYDRLGKPLPGRDNIVISRGGFHAAGITLCTTLEQALEEAQNIASAKDIDEIFIIGGARIYQQSLPFIERLYLTRIHKPVDGDAFFPDIDEKSWECVEQKDFPAQGDQPSFSFYNLIHRPA